MEQRKGQNLIPLSVMLRNRKRKLRAKFHLAEIENLSHVSKLLLSLGLVH